MALLKEGFRSHPIHTAKATSPARNIIISSPNLRIRNDYSSLNNISNLYFSNLLGKYNLEDLGDL